MRIERKINNLFVRFLFGKKYLKDLLDSGDYKGGISDFLKLGVDEMRKKVTKKGSTQEIIHPSS